jgi:sugar lactone lactonase YvrE
MRRLVVEWRASDDAAASFGDVSGLAVAPDGRVYVWDPATPSLWLMSADGKSAKAIGRKGRGLGEYERPNGIALSRDGRS